MLTNILLCCLQTHKVDTKWKASVNKGHCSVRQQIPCSEAPGIWKRWYSYLSLLDILSRKNCSGRRIPGGKEQDYRHPQPQWRLIQNVTRTEKLPVFQLSVSRSLSFFLCKRMVFLLFNCLLTIQSDRALYKCMDPCFRFPYSALEEKSSVPRSQLINLDP